MNHFHIAAALLTLAAAASYLNHRFIKLPTTVGMMVIALVSSMVLVGLSHTGILNSKSVLIFVRDLDLGGLLLHGMLGFLLFAGALHINLDELRTVKAPVTILASIGTLIATLITGSLFWMVCQWLNFEIPFLYALIFGALISPTDPIAVTGILRKIGAPKNLEINIAGESLFNDGIAVVIFIILLDIATGTASVDIEMIGLMLFKEVLGGILIGLSLGWLTTYLIRSLNHSANTYQLEILLTLALVASVYALSEVLHVSAPISVVVAGLLIGNHGRNHSAAENSRQQLDNFWELVDELLNVILFVLIGLEMVALDMRPSHLLLGVLATFTVLIGRFISVSIPIKLLLFRRKFSPGAIRILTWAGLRGGISIAMALSLPHNHERGLILSATYVVVIFSVLVQGLTLGKLVKAISKTHPR